MITELFNWQRLTPSVSGWFAVRWWSHAPVQRVLVRRYVPLWDDPAEELTSGALDFCCWQDGWGMHPCLLDPRKEAVYGSLWRYLGPPWTHNAPQPSRRWDMSTSDQLQTFAQEVRTLAEALSTTAGDPAQVHVLATKLTELADSMGASSPAPAPEEPPPTEQPSAEASPSEPPPPESGRF